MSKECWKCKNKIGVLEKTNRFIERKSGSKIWIHNDCYLRLSKDEMKMISYDIKAGPPSGLRKNLKLEGFFLGGIAGGLIYSEGAFSGAMWATEKKLKKKGMTFEELDNRCINDYGYHYPILPNNIQNKILTNI